MNFSNKITNSNKVKRFISVFVIFYFMNNLIAFGSENKSSLLKSKNVDNLDIFIFGIYGHYTKRGYELIAEKFINIVSNKP